MNLQDEYSPLNLVQNIERNGEDSESESNHTLDGGEVGEVDVLRMVADCFNKYDNVNLGGSETIPTHDDGVDDVVHEAAHCPEDGFVLSDNEGSDDETEERNNPMESRGTTMNMNDPSGIAVDILLRDAKTPLYVGSSSNRLTSTLMLLVCCTTFGVPNKFVDELLKLLRETILPKGNTLPKTFYEAKCMLMKLGLSYDSIHA